MSSLRRFCSGLTTLEAHLPITDLLGDGLEIDVAIALTRRKAPRVRITASEPVQFLELAQREAREIHLPVDPGLGVCARHEPGPGFQVDVFPSGLQQLADPASRPEADPERQL